MIKCRLDENECVDLLAVLRILNQINQEQAWAICYEAVATMQCLGSDKCSPIDSLAQIYLHTDGHVHEKTFSSPNKNEKPTTTTTTNTTIEDATDINQTSRATPPQQQLQKLHLSQQQQQHQIPAPPTPPITPELNEVLRRRPALNEGELVASLGIALFWALDYGIPDDEERKLSIAMEYLIYQSQSKLSLDEVAEICINRLPVATRQHADSHYREVCKSLVGDTIELSIFLEKIYTASMVLGDITLDHCLDSSQTYKGTGCDIVCADDHDMQLSKLGEPLASLRALRFNDWARLWMQVIRELRQRGKFKQALAVN